MTKTQLKTHLIKMIHILKNKNCLSDEDYKYVLEERFGVESSKDLSIEQLREFALSLGYEENLKSKKFYKEKASTLETLATQKQIDMINAMWVKYSNKKTQWALREFIYNIIKRRPLYLNSLSKAEASNIIQALKNIENRSETKA